MTMRTGVGIDLLDGRVDQDSRARSAAVMLDQLVWWGLALREARDKRPYTS